MIIADGNRSMEAIMRATIVATLLWILCGSPALGASASASASSSSSGGVTISGACAGNCTVRSSASVTRNGVTTTRSRTQVGTGAFVEHGD